MLENKLELLLEDYWGNKHIKEYFNLSNSIVSRIKRNVSIHNGLSFIPRKVELKKILKCLDLDFDTEIEILHIVLSCKQMYEKEDLYEAR